MSYGLADYFNQGISGPGQGTMSDVVGLAKALELNWDGVSTSGAANRVLDVQEMLKYVCFSKPDEAVFFNQLPKAQLYDSLSTADRATSNGTLTGGFSAQGELPPENDGTYDRVTERVKFMTTIGAVTDPMASILPAHGNLMELKTRERILYLIQRINHYCYFGNADLSLAGSGSGFEFNGIFKQIDSANVTDLASDSRAAQPISQPVIDQVVTNLIDKFASPKLVNLSNQAMHDFNVQLGPKERLGVPMNGAGIVGSAATGQLSSTGKPIMFAVDRFLRGTLYGSPSPSATATSPQAPNPPQAVTAAVNTGVTTGNFLKGDPTGATSYYMYAITLGNRFGESAPVLLATAATMTNANAIALASIQVVVTNPAVIGPFAPDWIGVYRTTHKAASTVPAGVSNYSLIDRRAIQTVSAGGTNTLQDNNLYLPFTEKALVWSIDSEELEMKQLLPMMYKPLADVSFAKRFGLAYYATPHDYVNTKQWALINIGTIS